MPCLLVSRNYPLPLTHCRLCPDRTLDPTATGVSKRTLFYSKHFSRFRNRPDFIWGNLQFLTDVSLGFLGYVWNYKCTPVWYLNVNVIRQNDVLIVFLKSKMAAYNIYWSQRRKRLPRLWSRSKYLYILFQWNEMYNMMYYLIGFAIKEIWWAQKKGLSVYHWRFNCFKHYQLALHWKTLDLLKTNLQQFLWYHLNHNFWQPLFCVETDSIFRPPIFINVSQKYFKCTLKVVLFYYQKEVWHDRGAFSLPTSTHMCVTGRSPNDVRLH